jgi:uncharacterized membrane protein
VIVLLGALALACFVSMVVALLVGIKLAAELQDLQDEKRARRSQRTGSPQPPEWVNDDE